MRDFGQLAQKRATLSRGTLGSRDRLRSRLEAQQQSGKLACGLRPADEIALHFGAAFVPQALKLLVGFDALGFGPNRRFSAFVAERNEIVIGMVTYSDRYSTNLASPIVYVQDIYVEDRHRTRGVGTALLARVAAEATERRLPLIELTMRDGNPAAKIYRRCGFRRVPHCATFAAAGQTLAELAQQFADATATAVGM